MFPACGLGGGVVFPVGVKGRKWIGTVLPFCRGGLFGVFYLGGLFWVIKRLKGGQRVVFVRWFGVSLGFDCKGIRVLGGVRVFIVERSEGIVGHLGGLVWCGLRRRIARVAPFFRDIGEGIEGLFVARVVLGRVVWRVFLKRGEGIGGRDRLWRLRVFVGLGDGGFVRVLRGGLGLFKRGKRIVCGLCLRLRRIIGGGFRVFECGERVRRHLVCGGRVGVVGVKGGHKIGQIPVTRDLGGGRVVCLPKCGHHVRQVRVVRAGLGGGGVVLVKRRHHIRQVAVRFRGRVRGVVPVVKGRHHIAKVGVRLGRGIGGIVVTSEGRHHVTEIGTGFRGLGRIAVTVIAKGGQHIRQITTRIRRRCVTVVGGIKGGHHVRQVIVGGGFGLGFRFGQHRCDAVEIDHRDDRFGLGFGRRGLFDDLFFDRLGRGFLFLDRFFGGFVHRLKLFVEQFQA